MAESNICPIRVECNSLNAACTDFALATASSFVAVETEAVAVSETDVLALGSGGVEAAAEPLLASVFEADVTALDELADSPLLAEDPISLPIQAKITNATNTAAMTLIQRGLWTRLGDVTALVRDDGGDGGVVYTGSGDGDEGNGGAEAGCEGL